MLEFHVCLALMMMKSVDLENLFIWNRLFEDITLRIWKLGILKKQCWGSDCGKRKLLLIFIHSPTSDLEVFLPILDLLFVQEWLCFCALKFTDAKGGCCVHACVHHARVHRHLPWYSFLADPSPPVYLGFHLFDWGFRKRSKYSLFI